MLTDMLLRIALAGVLGGLIGLERQMRAKEAGLRTHILVGIGSALFMLVSKYGFADMLSSDHVGLDPSRIAAQVVSGMGFLGAGTIIIQKQIVKGLTTAAGLWVTAAIGLVIGSGMYEIGIYGTLLALVVLEVFRRLSHWLIGRHHTLIVHLKAKSVPLVLLVLQREGIRYGHIAVVNRDEESGLCELSVEVTLSRRAPRHSLYEKVMDIKGVQSLEMV
ncbi:MULTISPECIES: MgtC/SapB family protein [Pantoea]|jgi:putative Mg2+ transporter-C (MgtC) family protein|uniref:Protein MgtC n=1 Tax=Pantoea eucrina TaxID=472693 RepID=A0ABS1Z125_9GAMM|nr:MULTISPECIES: MgtC/SapB family protein [Pantoea]PPS58510.1 methyltransferase [Pantoea sp. BRM17]AIX51218.1 methyltransferase [Pantoea sp. PSNIH1]MBM0746085.1 MgtC/SapB family protein [Pantoea eucrina]MCL9645745.1 MgtC/SapB family protein [Pantoea eucrina]MDJ0024680.1 MgtC/SapB family protein [Pantoea eucrina]